MANCKFCGKEITWMKEGRKSVPVESDGGVHECEHFKNARKSIKKISRDELDPELVKQYEENMRKSLKK